MEEMRRGYSARAKRMGSVPHRNYNGPPPVGSLDAIAASKGFTPNPQSYEDLDPAVLAYMPERIRTGSGPTSGVINPPTLSAIRAAAASIGRTPAQGTIPNKSSETLVEKSET